MSDRLLYVMGDAREALVRATDAYEASHPDVLHPLAHSRIETYADPGAPIGSEQPGVVMPPTTSPTPQPPSPGDVEGRRMCDAHRRAVHLTVARLLDCQGWPTTIAPPDPRTATPHEVTFAARWAAACFGLVARFHGQLDGDDHRDVRRRLHAAAGQARGTFQVWDRVPRDVAWQGTSAVQRHLDRSGTAVSPPRWWPQDSARRCQQPYCRGADGRPRLMHGRRGSKCEACRSAQKRGRQRVA